MTAALHSPTSCNAVPFDPPRRYYGATPHEFALIRLGFMRIRLACELIANSSSSTAQPEGVAGTVVHSHCTKTDTCASAYTCLETQA